MNVHNSDTCCQIIVHLYDKYDLTPYINDLIIKYDEDKLFLSNCHKNLGYVTGVYGIYSREKHNYKEIIDKKLKVIFSFNDYTHDAGKFLHLYVTVC